ncbi:hypothetical protein M8C21_006524 [Ambrosia artemisiifolia]|uniref:Uncharacterized protein n=1 Tax=Ambrosia artemisiifolia TaxID=4212 RepID=A0AAD5DII1_AMBAR|nr:hypothetical protein M8C21_006524 [Ambrosia artemisiifolia]
MQWRRIGRVEDEQKNFNPQPKISSLNAELFQVPFINNRSEPIKNLRIMKLYAVYRSRMSNKINRDKLQLSMETQLL